MAVINVLDKHIAELIAAGEVVERPSSVIKELVENAIDAGATDITVEIKNGGNTYMRVSDNGCGICREDVPKAFLRHATSKIACQGDLDSIATLGFRGEALASICAVARVELLTRCEHENIGTHYTIAGSDEQEIAEAGCPKGSTIIVRDLFYNVPARMKFLKKDISEGNAVAGIIDRVALSHPEISFTFIRDGKTCLSTSGNGDIKAAIYSVYGKEFALNLLNVDYGLNGVSVKGFVSKPTMARHNRNMQHFYLNGRYVKSRTAMAALEEAMRGTVMVGKFPACVLYITIPCETVDVNVHPAKIEVRFMDERPIFDAIYHAVKTAVLKSDRPDNLKLPSVTKADVQNSAIKKSENPSKPTVNEPSESNNPVLPAASIITDNISTPEKEPDRQTTETKNTCIVEDPAKNISAEDIKNSIQTNTPISEILKNRYISTAAQECENDDAPEIVIPKKAVYIEQNADNQLTKQSYPSAKKPATETLWKAEENEQPQIKLIGEIFETYILIQKSKDEIVIIDKHAAHERIIYEKLKKEHGAGFAQYLLEPVAVNLTKDEYDSVISNANLLSEAGFEIEDFGNGTVLVRSAPQYLDNYSIKDTVEEIAGYLLDNSRSIHTEQIDWIYHSISCRAAIKAGHKTSDMELLDLAKQLEKNPELMYCPHGRPITVSMTKKELEKQFGRIQ